MKEKPKKVKADLYKKSTPHRKSPPRPYRDVDPEAVPRRDDLYRDGRRGE